MVSTRQFATAGGDLHLRIFGPDHEFAQQFDDISYKAMYRDGQSAEQAFERGRVQAQALLKGAIYELEVLSEPTQFTSAASVDPELWEHVRRQVESEQWALVASQTMIFVESRVRQWAGLPESKYGQELMVAVQAWWGPLPARENSG